MKLRNRKRRVRQSRRRNISFFRRLGMESLEGRRLLNGSYILGDTPEPYETVEQTAPVADADTADELLQFTAGGHVLGFASDSVYLATGSHAFHVEFVGAQEVSPQAEGAGEAEQGKAAALGHVSYVGLWEGITLNYDAVPGGIAESTYVLAPGADPGQIKLKYNVPVQIDAAGELVMSFETGQMRESAPVAWQDVDGLRRPVAVSFQQSGDRQVGFALGQYDPTTTLTIDPTLTWHTFLGSSTSDYIGEIAVDGAGNVYVAGTSTATWGSPLRPFNPAGLQYDAFVAKLASDGSLAWNTFLGGSGSDWGQGIAVDGDGNVYVAGESRNSWGSPENAHNDVAFDAFVAVLGSDGALMWHTFFGGGSNDSAQAIALDGSGNIYVAGISRGTWGAPTRDYTANKDAFAAKLNSSGDVEWNAFFGGSDHDDGYDVAVDQSGNVYIAGVAKSTWGSPVRPFSGNLDAFAAKLTNSGFVTWHTFLGDSGADHGYGIAVDGSGNVYVTGDSSFNWGLPVTPPSAHADAFAAKLDSDGALTWNAFLGGDSADVGNAIAVDGSGNVYVVGNSAATWGSPAMPYKGWFNDAFAAKLTGDGSLTWNTFLGSDIGDEGESIALDESGNVYVAGASAATWGSPVRPYTSRASDVFVALVVAQAADAEDDFPETLENEAVVIDVLGNDLGAGKTVTDATDPKDGSVEINPDNTITYTPRDGFFGTDTFDYTIRDDAGCTDTATVTVTVHPSRDLAGVHRNRNFFVDINGNGKWDRKAGGDMVYAFGGAGDLPLVGDWDGDGFDEVGVFRPVHMKFYLDLNGNGVWDGRAGGDEVYRLGGTSSDSPIVGDFNGDGKDEIGLFRGRKFLVDYNGNGRWDGTVGGDQVYVFGTIGDLPLVGDFNGDGTDDVGCYRPTNKKFYLDLNGSHRWDEGDMGYFFKDDADVPLTGDWDGDGTDEIGTRVGAVFFMDLNGNGRWDRIANGDKVASIGFPTDAPVIGKWAQPAPLMAAPASPGEGGNRHDGPFHAGPAQVDDQLAIEAAAAIDELVVSLSSTAPLSAPQLRAIQDVSVYVTDLPGATLGQSLGNTIWIDVNAAGHGWFVEKDEGQSAKGETESFIPHSDLRLPHAMDLLTVLAHEIGHVLGYEHADGGWMDSELPSGTRRLWGDDFPWLDSSEPAPLPLARPLDTSALDAAFAADE